MKTKLEKRGRSIWIKIPKEIVKKAGLAADSEIIAEYADQNIILSHKKSLKLKDFLSQVTKDNCHPEIFCDRVGKEAL